MVHYYLRSGYHRHAQTVCSEQLKKRANDPTMLFWRGVAMFKEGQATEAVRELETLSRRADAQMQLTAGHEVAARNPAAGPARAKQHVRAGDG